MHFLSLIPSLSPSFSEHLRRQTDELLCKIVNANLKTQFAQTTPELTEFRHGAADADDDGALTHMFRTTVQFTSYDSYAPFVARLLQKPCKVDAVVDLLAPGLPDYLAESSSTSGGHSKTFPKYNWLPKDVPSDALSSPISDPLKKRTVAHIYHLRYDRMDVVDEDNCAVAAIYISFGSVVGVRSATNLHPEKDEEKMGTFVLDHTAPYATEFIGKWRSFLLIHALFALGSRSLEAMYTVFINTFVDMVRYIDADFDLIVDCIGEGTIPDLEGLSDVRHHLESNVSPDPERAEELRRLGRPSSRPAWCSHVWPNLRSITCITSGSFASCVPLAQWYLGPHVDLCPLVYGCTECLSIALPYNPLESNQYKLNGENITEFLDISKNDNSINALTQIWEVELGKRYEVVLTTREGLWRYRLGDVVEIAGFDPTDGTPIIQFLERRNVIMRFPNFMVTENELRAAMSSAPLFNVVDWTATIDDRRVPTTIGFFVELASDHAYGISSGAPEHVLDTLVKSNENIARALANALFRKPTIRFLRPGTFSAFRQMKLDEGGNNLGQVKIPVVLPKPAYVTWFLEQVVEEL